ncbi:hypothetical protein BH11PSE9_BH11PSE9_10420 [soil metagenome]
MSMPRFLTPMLALVIFAIATASRAEGNEIKTAVHEQVAVAPPGVVSASLLISRQGAPAASVVLDVAALARIGVRQIRTAVPWDKTGVVQTWEGVPLSQLVASQKAAGRDVYVSALDDYGALVPASDIVRLDPILAWLRDGKPIRVKDKGPFVVIYPFTANPDLSSTETYNTRSVWHAKQVDIR